MEAGNFMVINQVITLIMLRLALYYTNCHIMSYISTFYVCKQDNSCTKLNGSIGHDIIHNKVLQLECYIVLADNV